MSETIQQMPHEDEIDLRELLRTIIRYKKFIVVITVCVTLFAVVYSFLKTPIYEVKAILEIGYFTNTNTNTFLESPANLIQRLELNYIDNQKESKETSFLSKALLIKGTNNLVELVIEAQSNEEGLKKLNAIVDEVKLRHQKVIEAYLKQMHIKISNIQAQKEELLVEKEKLSNFISNKTLMVDQILKDNPAVAAIYSIELNNKSLELTELKNKIYTLNNQLSDLELLIAPSNVKETSFLGNITKSNKPVKPKKTLIVVVACVTGFILSIFMIFLFEMFRSPTNEE